MGLFGQRRDTIEWQETRPDVLFFKWKNDEIKKGSTLVIRPGQQAIFYANGKIEGIFEQEGSFDIVTEIVPFLSSLSGFFKLRTDTGMRAEVYFINSKELLMNWGTRQRIMIPTPEVPTGIPVGMNGNLVIEFRDYLTFIQKIAGIKPSFTISDISDRILGELDGIIAEAILGNQTQVGINALFALQSNNRALGKKIQEEIDKEMYDIGLGISDLNIISVNYPPEIQQMAEKVAAQSFVTDTAKYATIAMADGMEKGGSSVASAGIEMAMGMQMAANMMGGTNQQQPQQGAPVADRFCPTCRKMVSGAYCSDCGTKTV